MTLIEILQLTSRVIFIGAIACLILGIIAVNSKQHDRDEDDKQPYRDDDNHEDFND